MILAGLPCILTALNALCFALELTRSRKILNNNRRGDVAQFGRALRSQGRYVLLIIKDLRDFSGRIQTIGGFNILLRPI